MINSLVFHLLVGISGYCEVFLRVSFVLLLRALMSTYFSRESIIDRLRLLCISAGGLGIVSRFDNMGFFI